MIVNVPVEKRYADEKIANVQVEKLYAETMITEVPGNVLRGCGRFSASSGAPGGWGP